MSLSKHLHGEAFMMMTYQCSRCEAKKRVWNSRDGVTPFMLACDCGYSMHHDFSRDFYMEGYKPGPDELVFVDETRKKHLHGQPKGAPRMVKWGEYKP